jgi:hypothetical protein
MLSSVDGACGLSAAACVTVDGTTVLLRGTGCIRDPVLMVSLLCTGCWMLVGILCGLAAPGRCGCCGNWVA